MKTPERRKHPRIIKEFEIIYAAGEEDTVKSLCKDISASGIAFATFQSLDIGSSIDFEIQIPKAKKKIPVTGLVVRSWTEKANKHYCAVEFTKISLTDFEFLLSYTAMPEGFTLS